MLGQAPEACETCGRRMRTAGAAQSEKPHRRRTVGPRAMGSSVRSDADGVTAMLTSPSRHHSRSLLRSRRIADGHPLPAVPAPAWIGVGVTACGRNAEPDGDREAPAPSTAPPTTGPAVTTPATAGPTVTTPTGAGPSAATPATARPTAGTTNESATETTATYAKPSATETAAAYGHPPAAETATAEGAAAAETTAAAEAAAPSGRKRHREPAPRTPALKRLKSRAFSWVPLL